MTLPTRACPDPVASWSRSSAPRSAVRTYTSTTATSKRVGSGLCAPCVIGDPVLCVNNGLTIFGTTPDLPGGQAEAAAVPNADTSAIVIPDGVDDEQAVLLTDILPTG